MPTEDIHSDSGWFQEEQKRALPESPGKSMLMKFIDCSGTDITEKVKEVNDKEYEKVNKEIEKMKEETERKFEQVNENQKGLEKVEELNEKDLEARLKEDFFIPAEEETDESSTDVKEQDVGTEVVELEKEVVEVEKEVVEEAEDVVEVVKEVVEVVPEPPVEADLEVLEISHPKVQEVLIVLDEDEDKASGFDCILEKVDSSPEKIEPTISELAGQGQMIAVQGSVEERHSAMPSVARSFEEEFSKFTKKKVVQAESEVDSDSGQKELEGNFSADDENDEESGAENGLVVNSPAWSSLSLILEPQACL